MIALLPLLLSIPMPPNAQDLDKSLERYQAWRGDGAAIAGLGNVQIKSKVKANWIDGELDLKEWIGAKRQARIEVTKDKEMIQAWGTDGKLAWEKRNGVAQSLPSRWATALVRVTGCMVAIPRDNYYGAVREGKADAKTTGLVLDFTPLPPEQLGFSPNASPLPVQGDRWILDPASGALQSVACTLPLPDKTFSRIKLQYADWRVVEGVRFPFERRITFEQDGTAREVVIKVQSVATQLHFLVDPYVAPKQLATKAEQKD